MRRSDRCRRSDAFGVRWLASALKAAASRRTPKAVLDPIDLRGQNEIAARQAVDGVRPDRDAHFAPRQKDVGVMSLLLGDRPDFVREGQRLRKVGKSKFLLEMMFLHDLPAVQL